MLCFIRPRVQLCLFLHISHGPITWLHLNMSSKLSTSKFLRQIQRPVWRQTHAELMHLPAWWSLFLYLISIWALTLTVKRFYFFYVSCICEIFKTSNFYEVIVTVTKEYFFHRQMYNICEMLQYLNLSNLSVNAFPFCATNVGFVSLFCFG